MTLHPEEVAELRQKSLRGSRHPIERLERGIDTGWILNEYKFFTKEKDIGEYWISHGKVWGPKCAGKYSVDKEGRILSGDGRETGFYITEDGKNINRVYGPSPDLPWMK